jgi:transaldolase
MNYLQWLARETPTVWWHDSADPAEIQQALAWGARGVTTNPVLAAAALESDRERKALLPAPADGLPPRERAIHWMGSLVRRAAEMLRPIHQDTQGQHGHVCGQLDPSYPHDRQTMAGMAERYRSWAPNISLKFPATAAGLDALEESCAKGASVTSTVSFSVAQVMAAAQRHRRARERAGGRKAPGFAVIMIGRVDDYLREIARDCRAEVSEEDIQLAGLAVAKRAYRLLKEGGYAMRLMVAALRGPHHMAGMCGGELVMSIHPKVQKQLLEREPPRASGIDGPVPADAIRRLQAIPEFVRLYEPDGMKEADFLSLGLTQKTLTQFVYQGWSLLESFR